MTDSRSIVLSIDAELAWGFHDLQTQPADRIESARESWLTLLDLFERNDLPATWAVVGHLFLERCNGRHEDHPAGEEWFARDPGGVASSTSEWFGRDLIEAILDSDVGHEIGSHSFSHVEFGAPETTPEIAAAELRHSREAATEYELEPTSFVFPRNNIGYRELLAEHGFTCYRGATPLRWYDEVPLRRAGKFLSWGSGTSAPPIVTPTVDQHGLVDIPASLYLFDFEGPPRTAVETVTTDPVVRQVELGIERLANAREGVFHLWLHPNNITTARDHDRMETVISMVTECRDRHDVTVETMAQVERRVRNDE